MIYEISNINDNGNFDVECMSSDMPEFKLKDISEDDFAFWLQNYDNTMWILCYDSIWRLLLKRFSVHAYFNMIHSLN